jgi:RES domain-containing protein
VRLETFAYRGHNPRWSFAPTSGAGAAIRGGRFNPKGVEALYLALTPTGAILEATQGFAYKFNPLVLCSYEVDCDDIVDLSTPEACAAADAPWEHLSAPWALDLAEGRRPKSWSIHDRFTQSAAGILVSSFAVNAAPGMTNLVLWRWSGDRPHKVTVFDPEHRLPRDARSWQ